MSVFLLIASLIMWVAALVMIPSRPLYAPAFSYLGLLGISFCETNGVPWIPVQNSMLISWLCITIVVMLATMLQPMEIRRQTRGMAYIMGGAIVGLAIGLLGFTVSIRLPMLYGIMIVAVAVGIFFGFLLYSNTPHGRKLNLSLSSSEFFRYLTAKGFPAAVTVMQIGLVLVVLIATRSLGV